MTSNFTPTPPDLASFNNAAFVRGRPKVVEGLWHLLQAMLLSSWLPGSFHRRMLLRVFGASIGTGVVIKPGVRVKFPWKLKVGNHSWIGEHVWIDNLAPVTIGANCCLSQGAYLCTGSHDWSRRHFDLIVKPIRLEDGAWVAAKACVGPGVTVGQGAILAMGSVAVTDLAPWQIYQGNKAVHLKSRVIQ